MDFSYSTSSIFDTKSKNWLGKKRNIVKNRGVEYEKSMLPHGIKGITRYYHLVLHHWSSRTHGIQGCLMIISRQNLKTWLFWAKKSQKSQKLKFRWLKLGNMYLTGYSLANRYYTANYTRTTIHHVSGEKYSAFQLFNFPLEMANGQVLRFWRPIIMR